MAPRAAVVACLVILAGCPAAGTQTSTTALTPAPVPDDATYPPGIAAGGVVDPARLATAHDRALDETSFTITSNRTLRAANGSLRSGLTVRVRLATNRSYHVWARTAGPAGPTFLGSPPVRAEFWGNGSVYVRAVSRDGSPRTYNEFTPPDAFVGTWRYWQSTVPYGGEAGYASETFETLFRSIPTRLTGTRAAGATTLYRLSGSRAASTAFADVGAGPITDLAFEAWVAESGVVRSLDLSYRRTVDGRPVTFEWSLAYERVGRTTVQRPPWFDRAIDQSSRSIATS